MDVGIETICFLILIQSTYAANNDGSCLCAAKLPKRPTFSSCFDVFNRTHNPPDGEYLIDQGSGTSFRVYCEFRSNCIYTYIAKTGRTDIIIDAFYNNNREILVRHKRTNGSQYEVRYGQINLFSDTDISIQYNSSTDYKPIQNDALFPYVYVGLVPKAEVNKGDTYGFRVNEEDYLFTNCDGNQNSYFALLFNSNNESTTGRSVIRKGYMSNWITQASPVPTVQNLPHRYFAQFEMHFGGCGGFFTSDHVTDIVGVAFGLCYELTFSSCFDAYNRSTNPTSGEYLIDNGIGETYVVYCEFLSDRIYTYIARTDLATINIEDLFNNNTEILVRHKFSDGIQYEVSYGQINLFSGRNISIQYNSNTGYKTIQNPGMFPYVYVGLLPIAEVFKDGIYGYSVDGQDFTYTNCDGNQNAYFTLLFNANDAPTIGRGVINRDFMSKWRSEASPVSPERNLDNEFFVQYEVHFGGCGGYLTSNHLSNVKGVTFGLRYGKDNLTKLSFFDR